MSLTTSGSTLYINYLINNSKYYLIISTVPCRVYCSGPAQHTAKRATIKPEKARQQPRAPLVNRNFAKYTGSSFRLTFYFVLGWSQFTNNEVTVSGEQWMDSAMHTHGSILPQTPLPPRLPHNIKQTSLHYIAWYCWLSILNTAVCKVYWFSIPP